jgi:hypothetical protein
MWVSPVVQVACFQLLSCCLLHFLFAVRTENAPEATVSFDKIIIYHTEHPKIRVVGVEVVREAANAVVL